MRRKSDKDIKKECGILFILGCICIVFGLSVLFLPLIPSKPCDEYMEKEVVISEIDHFYGGPKGSSYDYIVTKDGEVYNITGEYNKSQLFELLAKETPAWIKYDINKVFPSKKYVEEMTVDGILVVKYNNDQPVNWAFPIAFCSIFCLLGIGLLFVYRSFITRNRKIQAKRDARIIRKYGNIKK